MAEIIQWALPAALAVTMFGMGLGLRFRDFAQLVASPKPVVIGTVAKMVGLPSIGFLTATLLGLDGPLALGLVLIAACPGGPTAILLTAFAYGDLALSIVLTAVSDVITIVSIPLVVNLAAERYMPNAPAVHLPVVRTMGEILLVTILPVALGMLVLYRRPRVAVRLEPAFRKLALAVLVVLIVGTLFKERANILDEIRRVGGAVIALNVLTVSMAWLVARLAGVDRAGTTAITIEVGMQNAVMAMTVALAMLNRAETAVPAIVYAGLMYFTAGVVVFWARKGQPSPVMLKESGNPIS